MMSVSKKEYAEMTKKASPKSPALLDCIKAFVFGGAICAFAEGLFYVFTNMGLSEKSGRSAAMIILIVITAILTAIGVFDIIAKHAGAGTAVPISGFANSIVATALEFQTEKTLPIFSAAADAGLSLRATEQLLLMLLKKHTAPSTG